MIEPLGALVVCRDDLGAHRVDLKAARSDLARIEPDADGRLLLAADVDETDAGDAGDLLREDHVGIIIDLVDRQRVRGERRGS